MSYHKFSQLILLFILVIFIACFIAGGMFLSKSSTMASGMDIYDKPNVNSALLSHADRRTPLVSIYRKGKWVKVGNLANGETGWMLGSDFKYIIPKQIISNNKVSEKQNKNNIKEVNLNHKYTQMLSLEQKLNKQLSEQPNKKMVDNLQKEYLSQLLLMKKMIENMQIQQN
ncbi:MAG: hypothetical protein ACJA0H_000729 [Francisellaceae bacterium]|jgi:hypothetical protein